MTYTKKIVSPWFIATLFCISAGIAVPFLSGLIFSTLLSLLGHLFIDTTFFEALSIIATSLGIVLTVWYTAVKINEFYETRQSRHVAPYTLLLYVLFNLIFTFLTIDMSDFIFGTFPIFLALRLLVLGIYGGVLYSSIQRYFNTMN